MAVDFGSFNEALIAPSPIILPDIQFEFGKSIDPVSGEAIYINLVIHVRSAPNVQFQIPFDRLGFSDFIRKAQIAAGSVEEGQNGGA
jgi:hypothetical protein